MPEILLALFMKWHTLGVIKIAEDGSRAFPVAPELPGLYRFRLFGVSEPRHYIGESENLKRRF